MAIMTGTKMHGTPVNRLESHWPEAPPPYPETLVDQEAWESRFEGWMDRAARLLGDHPQATLAAAVGLGLIFGWMIKRR